MSRADEAVRHLPRKVDTMEAKVRATVTMTDDELPEGFDRSGYAWSVTLRYRGKQLTTPYYTGSMAGEPTAASVLESLLMDASTIVVARGFEDWAADFGYDTDSRRALAMYHACQETLRKLQRFLGYELDAALNDPESWSRSNTIND